MKLRRGKRGMNKTKIMYKILTFDLYPETWKFIGVITRRFLLIQANCRPKYMYSAKPFLHSNLGRTVFYTNLNKNSGCITCQSYMTVEIRSCFFSLYVSWIFHFLRFNIEDILSETERRGGKRGQPLFYFCVILILYVHGHWIDLCDHYKSCVP
jgi:hypothetical protein